MTPRDTHKATKALKDLKPGKRYTLAKINPLGSVQARCTAAGLTAWWRFTINYKYDEVCIGVLDPDVKGEVTPVDGRYSIAAALKAAQDLAIRNDASIRAGGPGIKELLAKEAAEATAERLEARQYDVMTVAKLCDLYISKQRPQTQTDVKSIFKNIPQAIKTMPAKDVTKSMWIGLCKEVAATLGRPCRGVRQPKIRTANKLRSYISAAYNMAAVCDGDMNVDSAFVDFGITVNPIAGTVPKKQDNFGRDKDPLPTDEFREYLKLIKRIGGIKGAVLRIHALTGGLRMAQLVRMPVADYNRERKVFVLTDLKKGVPRKYTTPIIPEIQADFEYLYKLNGDGEYLFSTTGGMKQISAETVNWWISEHIKPVMPAFTPKRIRSATTTELTRLGIPKEIRDQLQSHDISGVEDDNYNGHDFVPEKLQALTALYEYLKPPEEEPMLKVVKAS